MMSMPRGLRLNLLLTDIGFVVYWLVTALGLLPAAWLFKDYQNPILSAWNWSFAPLDLAASALGLGAMALHHRGKLEWRTLALLSASLTFCAGLMALSFWTLRADFDPAWWAPNAYLMLWPVWFARYLLKPAGTRPA